MTTDQRRASATSLVAASISLLASLSGGCFSPSSEPDGGTATTGSGSSSSGSTATSASGSSSGGLSCLDGSGCTLTSGDVGAAGICSSCGGGCQSSPGCIVASCSGAPAGAETAGAFCCGGKAIDNQSDPSNCGSCGIICPTGSQCNSGACTLPDGGWAGCSASGGGLSGCPAGTICGSWNGFVYNCLAGGCAGTADGQSCQLSGEAPGGTGICCGGVCVDNVHSADDCGTCGNRCPSGTCTVVTFSDGTGSIDELSTCLPAATDAGCAGGCPSGEVCNDGLCMTRACDEPTYFCAPTAGGVGICMASSLSDGGFELSCEQAP